MKLDQMNLVLAQDNWRSEQIEHLAPHKNSLNPNKPMELTGSSSLPKPVASTIANWLNLEDDTPPTAEQAAFMRELELA